MDTKVCIKNPTNKVLCLISLHSLHIVFYTTQFIALHKSKVAFPNLADFRFSLNL